MTTAPQRGPAGAEGRSSSWALAVILGWGLLGLTNVALVALQLELPSGGRGVRLAHHAVDLGRHVALGLLSGVAVLGWQRVGGKPRALGLAALGVLSVCVGEVLLADDLGGIAARNHQALGVPLWPLHQALIVTVAGSIVAVAAVCPSIDRPWRKLVALLAAATAHYLNATFSPGANPGAHFFLSWLAALWLAAAVHGALLSAWRVRAPLGVRLGVGAAATALGGFGIVAPVSDSARVDLMSWHANVLPESALSTLLRDDDDDRVAPADGASRATDLSPTPHELLPKDGVVLLLSVDGFREDVLTSKNRKHLPNIWRLANEGTRMMRAYAPGSSTVYSLAALSTGRYFSQLHWKHIGGKHQWWPIEDESPHLAQLLSKAGVDTGHARGANWMGDDLGVLRGFRRSEFAKGDWRWAKGADSAQLLIEMLETRAPGKPLFLFTHFLDSHSPFWPAKHRKRPSRNKKVRYLHALAYVDEQIGHILSKVDDLGLRNRTTVIVTSDHGEAFGEHRTQGHNYTLYEEVVHVPMIVVGPKIPKQKIDRKVSLVDLGPTILDLFGQPTPPTFMGRSLVPFFLGKQPKLDRPIAAEAIGLRSMLFEDDIKVIQNRKNGVLQIYDLAKDPKERRNLSDDRTPKLEERVAQTKRFFAQHAFRKPGYEIPYRK